MLTPTARLLTFAEATLFIVLAFLMVFRMDANFFAPHIAQRPISLAVAFLVAQILATSMMLFAGVVTKWLRETLERRAEVRRLRITDELVRWLDGDSTPMRDTRGPDLEKCLVQMLCLLSGSHRKRLTDLAIELGCVERWENAYRSLDGHRRKEAVSRLALLDGVRSRRFLRMAARDRFPPVQREAARALIRLGSPVDVEIAFRAALAQPLLGRIILAAELRSSASVLSSQAIPSVLALGTPAEIVTALEIVESWGTAIELPDLTPCLRSADANLQAAAMRLLPLTQSWHTAESAVVDGLRSSEPVLRCAAAHAASRLPSAQMLPALEECAGLSTPETSRLACTALAGLGSPGLSALQRTVARAPRAGAAMAAEALGSRRPSLERPA